MSNCMNYVEVRCRSVCLILHRSAWSSCILETVCSPFLLWLFKKIALYSRYVFLAFSPYLFVCLFAFLPVLPRLKWLLYEIISFQTRYYNLSFCLPVFFFLIRSSFVLSQVFIRIPRSPWPLNHPIELHEVDQSGSFWTRNQCNEALRTHESHWHNSARCNPDVRKNDPRKRCLGKSVGGGPGIWCPWQGLCSIRYYPLVDRLTWPGYQFCGSSNPEQRTSRRTRQDPKREIVLQLQADWGGFSGP